MWIFPWDFALVIRGHCPSVDLIEAERITITPFSSWREALLLLLFPLL